MNTNTENTEHFLNKDEALDFLLQESMAEKRKKNWEKEFQMKEPFTQIAKRKFLTNHKISSILAAASVIILVGFFFGKQMNDTNLSELASSMIMETNFEMVQNTRGTRVEHENKNKALRRKAIEEGDYKTAIALFELMTEPKTLEDKFFYAVALSKMDQPNDTTIQMLTKDVLQYQNKFSIETLWISAVSNIRIKDLSTAEKQLQEFEKYNYQAKNVKILLDRINKI